MAEVKHSFDKILTEYIGGHGLFQWKLTLLMMPLFALSLGIIFVIVFTAYAPNHRCKIPNCDTPSLQVTENIFEHEWLKFTIPKKDTSSNFLGEKQEFDDCKMYKYIGSNKKCIAEHDKIKYYIVAA